MPSVSSKAKMKGAKLATMDPRLSNTASMSDYWMPTYPGSEAAVMLAMAKVILDEDLYNRPFLENWVNWHEYLEKKHPVACTFENLYRKMREEYAEYTPEFAEQESGAKAR
jgi:anaerobic selenocysteine-containing dehydrogenase